MFVLSNQDGPGIYCYVRTSQDGSPDLCLQRICGQDGSGDPSCGKTRRSQANLIVVTVLEAQWNPLVRAAILPHLRNPAISDRAFAVVPVAPRSRSSMNCLAGTMAKSRLSMRREVEAAEAAAAETSTKKKAARKAAGEKAEASAKKKAAKGEKDGAPKKKKAAKPRTRRAKEAAQRRRIVWVVYSATMREEGRFLYHEKDKADELLASLIERKKRRFFIQQLKETLNPDGTPISLATLTTAVDEVEEDAVKVDVEAADDIDIDAELEVDGEEPEEAETETEEAAPEA